MKKYQAIMFDMDGTLVPMDMKEFTEGYFSLLSQYLRDRGYPFETKAFASAVWTGTADMIKNDGKRTNCDVFWDKFFDVTKTDDPKIKQLCDEFYSTDFNKAKCFTQANPYAAEAVRAAHDKAECVILATNPFFPMAGQLTRASWVGLNEKDFDKITSYETSHYCKPNPAYFTEFLQEIELDPARCLMIGNDEKEDMLCASSLGIECWLAEDCLIPCKEHPWEGVRGSFASLTKRLKEL